MNRGTRLLALCLFLIWLNSRGFRWEAGMGEDAFKWAVIRAIVFIVLLTTAFIAVVVGTEDDQD